ncbi:WxPxxD family membrane protein [Peribacillus simplex]|uniref:WxPxxD family membrane protein n=1 Tax=Peribacillus simplex TaxID=1478 RepID=UPI003CEAAB24
MNYIHKNFGLFVVLFMGFFSFFWLMQNNIYLNDTTRHNILIYMNGSEQGFSSLRMISLFYTLCFLLLTNIQVKGKIQFIVRGKSRSKLFAERTFYIFCMAGLFSFSFCFVNLVLTYILIGNELMIEGNFYLITLFNWIAMTLFYFWIGIFGKVIEDKLNSAHMATAIVFILIGLSYFMDMIPWLPIKDMRIYEGLLTNYWDAWDLIIVYARQLGLAIAFYLLGNMIYIEKDFNNYET